VACSLPEARARRRRAPREAPEEARAWRRRRLRLCQSTKAKKILPAGALLWAWDADPDYSEAAGEKWLVLLPGKWNKQVQYAWRFDPCELRPPGTPCPLPRAPRFEAGAPDDEFLDETVPHVPRAARK
jgi:hypothetical protein